MSHTLSIITDEVSGDLATSLRFAADNRLGVVDMRSIGGVNFLSLPQAQQAAVARQVKDAGFSVGCLATPLLKWPAPGRTAATLGDQFGFDAGGRSVDQLYEDAFRAADLLGTRNLRVFSFLSYAGFEAAHLDADYEKLIRLAERHDCNVHVENEHVCNIGTIADLIATLPRWRHPRLRALLDIPNSWRAGSEPSAAELAAVMPYVEHVHFKDYSRAKGRFVALGEGDIPFAKLWPICLAAAGGRSLSLVVETHVPDEQPGASTRSLAALRRLVGA